MRYKLDEYITQITSLIDKENTDHTNLDKLGDQLADMGQHSKAFAMFIGSNQISKAIALLQEQNIELTDDLVKYFFHKFKVFITNLDKLFRRLRSPNLSEGLLSKSWQNVCASKKKPPWPQTST